MKKTLTTLLILCTFGLSAQTTGLNMFDDSYVHEIRVTFNDPNFWDTLEQNYDDFFLNGAEIEYTLASVEVDGTVLDSIGIREKGYLSNWGLDYGGLDPNSVKKPLKINFKKFVSGQRYDGLNKINLQNSFQDPTFMRDALAYKFMRDAGIPAPRTSHAKVYLNDTYWGLYVVVEQVDKRFLTNWYGDNEGNLFKNVSNTTLEWQGDDPVEYQDEFELRTNKSSADWSNFVDLIDRINTPDEFSDSIRTRFKLEEYLKVLAADVLMYNWDSYYNQGKNFYLYEDTAGVFSWIPWDYNYAFSDFETDILIEYDNTPISTKPLVVGVMNNFRGQYFQELCNLLDEFYNLNHLGPYIDAQRALITDAVDSDPNKFCTLAQFNDSFTEDVLMYNENIKALKPAIEERYQVVHDQLTTHNYDCSAYLGIDDLAQTASSFVYPNPTDGVFFVSTKELSESVTIYNIAGDIIMSLPVTNSLTHIDLSGYTSGIYFVSVAGESGVETLKLVKK